MPEVAFCSTIEYSRFSIGKFLFYGLELTPSPRASPLHGGVPARGTQGISKQATEDLKRINFLNTIILKLIAKIPNPAKKSFVTKRYRTKF